MCAGPGGRGRRLPAAGPAGAPASTGVPSPAVRTDMLRSTLAELWSPGAEAVRIDEVREVHVVHEVGRPGPADEAALIQHATPDYAHSAQP